MALGACGSLAMDAASSHGRSVPGTRRKATTMRRRWHSMQRELLRKLKAARLRLRPSRHVHAKRRLKQCCARLGRGRGVAAGMFPCWNWHLLIEMSRQVGRVGQDKADLASCIQRCGGGQHARLQAQLCLCQDFFIWLAPLFLAGDRIVALLQAAPEGRRRDCQMSYYRGLYDYQHYDSVFLIWLSYQIPQRYLRMIFESTYRPVKLEDRCLSKTSDPKQTELFGGCMNPQRIQVPSWSMPSAHI